MGAKLPVTETEASLRRSDEEVATLTIHEAWRVLHAVYQRRRALRDQWRVLGLLILQARDALDEREGA